MDVSLTLLDFPFFRYDALLSTTPCETHNTYDLDTQEYLNSGVSNNVLFSMNLVKTTVVSTTTTNKYITIPSNAYWPMPQMGIDYIRVTNNSGKSGTVNLESDVYFAVTGDYDHSNICEKAKFRFTISATSSTQTIRGLYSEQEFTVYTNATSGSYNRAIDLYLCKIRRAQFV